MKLKAPAVVSVIWQLPTPLTSVPEHVWEPPSLTVTVPVGVPLPVTPKLTVMGWPTTGPVVVLEIVVVELSPPTVTSKPAAVPEEAKFASPL